MGPIPTQSLESAAAFWIGVWATFDRFALGTTPQERMRYGVYAI